MITERCSTKEAFCWMKKLDFREFVSNFQNHILKDKIENALILKKRLVVKRIFSGKFFINLERKTQMLKKFSPLDGCFWCNSQNDIKNTRQREKLEKNKEFFTSMFWFVHIYLFRNNNLVPSAFFCYKRRAKKRSYLFKTALGMRS